VDEQRLQDNLLLPHQQTFDPKTNPYKGKELSDMVGASSKVYRMPVSSFSIEIPQKVVCKSFHNEKFITIYLFVY